MNKVETKKLLDTIKGYYNSQFFIDEYVINAWTDTMKPYELEDAIEHLQNYLSQYPEIAPKPHIFKKGLLTFEEKQRYRNNDLIVACQLCGRWMPLTEYDSHYDKCLDIEYLVNVAKEKGQDITRSDLEQYPRSTIDKLLKKHEPKKVDLCNTTKS